MCFLSPELSCSFIHPLIWKLSEYALCDSSVARTSISDETEMSFPSWGDSYLSGTQLSGGVIATCDGGKDP